MNKYLTISIFVLFNLFVTTGNSYACLELPWACIKDPCTPHSQTVCVGADVKFDGSWSEDGTYEIDEWNWEVEKWTGSHYIDYTTFSGESVDYVFSDPAKYQITLTVKDEEGYESDNSDICYVTAIEAWRPGPSPTASITCTNGQLWDHINDTRDSIPLAIENAVDHDEKCVNGEYVEQPENYINTGATEWSYNQDRGYCNPTTGASTNWFATSTAQPVEVKAKLIDYSSNPSTNANDSDVWTAEWTNLHGFKVGVRANFNGAWSGNSGDIWEDGSDYSFSSEDSIEIHAHSDGYDAEGEDEDYAYFYVSFDAKTEPSDAAPAGDIKADLDFGLSTYWYAILSDCDIVDQDGDSVSVGFTLSAYGTGGGISYGWTLEDDEEGIVAGDWAYTTDKGFGTNRVPSENNPLHKYQSGDYDDIPIQIHTEEDTDVLLRSATKEWEKGDYVRGQYDISVGSYATDHCVQDVGDYRCNLHTPVVKIENVGYSP